METVDHQQRPGRPLSWLVPIVGLLSLIWFLVRVIPKPSRATYPCQQAAFPIASGFVLWVVGFVTSITLFKQSRQKLFEARYVAAALCLVATVGVLTVTLSNTAPAPAAAANALFVSSEGPNQPMGEPQGIYPGRVVWVHDPEATPWKGTAGQWFEDGNTDPVVVSGMLSRGLQTVTGTTTDALAWDALFRYFNVEHGKGDAGYQAGENISIKYNTAAFDTAPQTVLALLRQLVHSAGVAPEHIAIYDITFTIPTQIIAPVHEEFPAVRFVSWESHGGRIEYRRDTGSQIRWSVPLDEEIGGGNPTYLPFVVSAADYLINLGNLKGHGLAGVTICAKNHFGSLTVDRDGEPYRNAPKGAGLHPTVAVHDYRGGGEWDFPMRDMGTYNGIVDLMGHEQIGGKTLLYLVDGLYALQAQNNLDPALDQRWQSAPFNGHWTSSLFLSQDVVAIESVGLDFLSAEPTMTQVYGNVDNYLHEAAMANDPPSGTLYDPEGDGMALASLGVHEHWNNPIDKQYSGNLGIEGGIELVTPQMVTAVAEQAPPLPRALALDNYPNPFNASTVLSFSVPTPGRTRLHLYDALGQQVAVLDDRHLEAGTHQIVWDGTNQQGWDMASGVYFVSLTTAGRLITHKILLAR